MKAYVIDQSQLKQYIFIAVIALILSFAFGYIVGDGQNAVSQKAPKQTIEAVAPITPSSLAMKKDDNVLTDKTEKKTVKKDLKKEKVEKKKEATKKPAEKKKVAVKKAVTKKPATEKKKALVQKKTIEKEKKSLPKQPKPKMAAVTAEPTEEKSANTSTSSKAESSDAVVQNKEQVDNKRYYSIQAGMFASRNNAESFIKKLATEKFEAYVSDFVSTSGAVKYNVRVGRFEERNKAREKLKEYQKFFSTPAYVVIGQ